MDDFTAYFREKVCRSLLNGIASSKSNVSGFLLGLLHDTDLYVHGYSRNSDTSQSHLEEEFDRAIGFLPGGLQACGLFFRTSQANVPKIIKSLLMTLLPSTSIMKECFVMDTILILAIDQLQPSNPHFYWFSFKNQELWPAKVGSLDDNHFAKSLVLFRLQMNLPLGFEHHDQQAGRLDRLLSEMQGVEDRVRGDTAVFHIVDSSSFPLLYNATDANVSESRRVSELLESVVPVQRTKEVSGGEVRGKRSTAGDADSYQRLVDVRMSFVSTGEIASKNCVTCTPVIHHEHQQFKFVRLSLPLDVLIYARLDEPVANLPTLFVDGAARQLRAMADCLVKHSQGVEYIIPKPFHFKLTGLDHLVIVIYPDSFADSKLESTRKSLHAQFLVETDRPVFRKPNAFVFSESRTCEGTSCLLDVHVGLSPSGVPDGKQYLVRGHYAYHHYLQDKFDDNGWGCAYRSLQTIVSWFRLQGYTDKPVPSHAEIQQALVTVGDKPPAFVGSKKWIGSTELSYVLDQLYGVTSKIFHVSSGGEMATKARELARHFETQGTPVMIGGGILAHTILGVDWNEGTGDVMFLILDPHYTGVDDLRLIQDKNWCSWKSADFWDKNVFYNLCLPQRPTVF